MDESGGFSGGACCREPLLTTKTQQFAGCLDYLWVSPQWMEVQGVLRYPFSEQEQACGASGVQDPLKDTPGFPLIPDSEFPSDHLPVGCMLQLRREPASASV